MNKPEIKDYDLDFATLTERLRTDMVVVHHTGNFVDDDLSAEQIHFMHLGNGWAGIGYHFVIRKNGIIEQGRPIEMIGSHAYGENWHTIGVHLCGNFEYVEPTPAQIESAAYLIGWICETYNIPTHRIVGHRDLMATACPGKYLYEQMDTLRGKAAWYMQHYKHGYYEENA